MMKPLFSMFALFALNAVAIDYHTTDHSFDVIVFAPSLPNVQYEVRMHGPSTPAYQEFTKLFDAGDAFQALRQANDFALQMLFVRRSIPLDTIGPNKDAYTKVILSLMSFPRNKTQHSSHPVITTGNEIRLNYDYVNDYIGDVGGEVSGILHHECTRVWQWTGNGAAPAGLVSGVADFVRLMSGFHSKEWPSVGSGLRWDEGNAVTAYFLEYCTGTRKTFVADLNAKMRNNYSESFFQDLLGKSVDQLWKEYKSAFAGNAPSTAPSAV
ncbi:hypothetical protein MLD38_034205 [Melastoma candidum]|uniref:Uncharacterized protein n=2 Tax=Melastoma candidum TaxID=119954 RepID=A0ACB9M8Y9_9MYRT|nr:hypothetical protein MLD38_034203 [Melastoma candidum]KAI4320760.1 hypothetical protein MLD38_034205 [Melastoma candidum]